MNAACHVSLYVFTCVNWSWGDKPWSSQGYPNWRRLTWLPCLGSQNHIWNHKDFVYINICLLSPLLIFVAQDRKYMTVSNRRTRRVHFRLYEYQSVVHPNSFWTTCKPRANDVQRFILPICSSLQESWQGHTELDDAWILGECHSTLNLKPMEKAVLLPESSTSREECANCYGVLISSPVRAVVFSCLLQGDVWIGGLCPTCCGLCSATWPAHFGSTREGSGLSAVGKQKHEPN